MQKDHQTHHQTQSEDAAVIRPYDSSPNISYGICETRCFTLGYFPTKFEENRHSRLGDTHTSHRRTRLGSLLSHGLPVTWGTSKWVTPENRFTSLKKQQSSDPMTHRRKLNMLRDLRDTMFHPGLLSYQV
ncbi:uncharacterized protein [Apostichopus japonicus]|uniref:uncharacterized protein n=1 Tax=Stichopus japonicus TaxID=307972 RepID=UPI003AB6AE00